MYGHGRPNESLKAQILTSDHLIPSRDNLHAYQKCARPVGISAANGGKVYAYSSGTFRVATSANKLGREADIRDVYYLPEESCR